MVGPSSPAASAGRVKKGRMRSSSRTTWSMRRLRLTAGGRYSWDELNAPRALLISPDAGFNPVYTPFSFDKRWKKFDWKVAFEADLGNRSMLYGNVQTGHNQGTFNAVLN